MDSTAKSSKLFSSVTFRGLTLKNRIAVAPMCQYRSVDGFVNDWHLAHYGSLAIGGAGLIICEGTAVEPRGLFTKNYPGLWKDEHIEPWTKVVKFIKEQGCAACCQLYHGGPKASGHLPWVGRYQSLSEEEGGWSTIAASSVPFSDQMTVPKEATIDDIEEIKLKWVAAAQRAVKAGFQMIEFYFAHGDLTCSFLSPVINKRTDKYGGSFENRIRFGYEIVECVAKALPKDIVLGVRLSVTDYAPNGWSVEESVEFARRLKTLGVDFIDCSSGGIVPNVDYNLLNAGQTQWRAANAIQSEAGVATGAVGQIVSPLVAEKLLRDNWCTLVIIGRAMLNNPHWAYQAADMVANADQFKYPDQYNWCIGWQAYTKWRKLLNFDKNSDENNNKRPV